MKASKQPKHIYVEAKATGRVVRLPVKKIWRDYFSTVEQFDDLSKEARLVMVTDTLINEPGFWETWFHEHIADDWDYILSMGKVVNKGRPFDVDKAMRWAEFSGGTKVCQKKK